MSGDLFDDALRGAKRQQLLIWMLGLGWVLVLAVSWKADKGARDASRMAAQAYRNAVLSVEALDELLEAGGIPSQDELSPDATPIERLSAELYANARKSIEGIVASFGKRKEQLSEENSYLHEFLVAVQLFLDSRPQEALEQLDEVIATDASFAPAFYLRGLLTYENAERGTHLLRPTVADGSAKIEVADALRDFESAIELEPAHARLYYHRAVCRAYGREHVGAIADFTFSVQARPQWASAYNLRGLSWLSIALLPEQDQEVRDLAIKNAIEDFQSAELLGIRVRDRISAAENIPVNLLAAGEVDNALSQCQRIAVQYKAGIEEQRIAATLWFWMIYAIALEQSGNPAEAGVKIQTWSERLPINNEARKKYWNDLAQYFPNDLLQTADALVRDHLGQESAKDLLLANAPGG